jgi:hypothetical protein
MQAKAPRRLQWKLPFGLGLAALVVVAMVVLIPAVASAGKATASHAEHAEAAQDELAELRQATARFHDLDAALEAGYELGYLRNNGVRIITGCIFSPTGAMGYHYFNKELVDDVAVDPLRPEVLVYAPDADGGRKLVAVEWVVPGPIWTDPPGVTEAPTLFGMEMHILVPAVGFWLMHAWIWKPNPDGIFADWNPEVSCP